MSSVQNKRKEWYTSLDDNMILLEEGTYWYPPSCVMKYRKHNPKFAWTMIIYSIITLFSYSSQMKLNITQIISS